MAERLRDDLNLRVTVPEDPLTTVASGAGRLLEDTDKLQRASLRLDAPVWKMRRSWRLIGSKVRSTDFRSRSSQFLPFCGILARKAKCLHMYLQAREFKDYNVSALPRASFLLCIQSQNTD